MSQALAPIVTSIVTPPGTLSRYMQDLITQAKGATEEYQAKITAAQERLQLATDQRQPGEEYKARLSIAKSTNDLRRAGRFLEALEMGYVPIPRLPAVKVQLARHLLPPEVMEIMDDAKAAGLFEEFRIIDGQDATAAGEPIRGRSHISNDPVLVGMIGREMFAVAWWR